MPSTDSLRTSFQAQISPGDDVEFLRLLTEADLRLLEFGRWIWTRGRLDLTPVAGVVTLPVDYAAILAARVDDNPVEVESEEYEYTPDGPGLIEVGGTHSLRLIDQGLDGSDQRTYKVIGEDDDDAYTIHTLSTYAPFTLHYPVDLPVAPTAADSDVTRCPSAAALKLMMRGIIYEEENDLGTSSHFVATALRNLDNRGKSRRGGAKKRLSLNPYGSGVGKIRNYR